MIPLSLKLSNFTSYGEKPLELNFSKFHLAAISGFNGAGKSSLLDAITWCVWGWARAGDSTDQLVHIGAPGMQVEFSFTLDGNTYTVKRSRILKGGGSTALELWSGSNNLTEGTIKATQEKIIDLLHLSFETFTNSSFLRQGHADEFTTKGPTDRKRILSDILGLVHYDELEEKAKEKIRDVDSKLKLLEYQVLEIEAELSQKDESAEKKVAAEKKISEMEIQIEKLEKELKELTDKKATLNANYEQQNKLKQTFSDLQTELNDILSQGKARAEKIKTLEEEVLKLPEIDGKLKGLKELEKQKEEYSLTLNKKLELKNKLSQVSSSLALKNQEKENLEKKLEEIKNHLSALDKESAQCPTCGQEIDKEQKDKVRSKYQLQQKEIQDKMGQIKTGEEEKEITKLQTEIDAIKIDDAKFADISSKINELSSLQDAREKLIASQATLVSEKRVVEDLRNLFKNKKAQVDKLAEEVKSLPNLQDNLETLQNQINQKQLELNNFKGEEKEARNLLGQATQLISRVEQMEKLYKQKKEERGALQTEKEGFEELALAFGKKGIQAMIIETAIPEIEDEANKLLQSLTNGRMQIRFETQKETKTKREDGEKGIVETLDIIISDETGEKPYENYSGGEQFRVNVAIRLALSKLLTRRAGAKLQFLVIDEGFGTQDQEGKTKIVEVLDTIKNDFEKILVITHLEELKEEFPVRIEVSKEAEGSVFELIGA